MISESIISLLPIIISYARKMLNHYKRHHTQALFHTNTADESLDGLDPDKVDDDDWNDDEPELEPPERLVPTSWVTIGLSASAILGVAMVWIIFGDEGIKP